MPDLEYYKNQYELLLTHNQELKDKITQLEKQVNPASQRVIDALGRDNLLILQLLSLVERQLTTLHSADTRVITLLIEDIYEVINGKEDEY